MLVPLSSFLSLRAEDLLVFSLFSVFFWCRGTQWRCIHVSVALFCIHPGGDKGTGGIPNGGGEQASFSQWLFISLGNWGLLQGIEDLGQSHFPLPWASASGTSLVWWSVSCSVVGLVWLVGVGTEHIAGGCVSSLTDL